MLENLKSILSPDFAEFLLLCNLNIFFTLCSSDLSSSPTPIPLPTLQLSSQPPLPTREREKARERNRGERVSQVVIVAKGVILFSQSFGRFLGFQKLNKRETIVLFLCINSSCRHTLQAYHNPTRVRQYLEVSVEQNHN